MLYGTGSIEIQKAIRERRAHKASLSFSSKLAFFEAWLTARPGVNDEQNNLQENSSEKEMIAKWRSLRAYYQYNLSALQDFRLYLDKDLIKSFKQLSKDEQIKQIPLVEMLVARAGLYVHRNTPLTMPNPQLSKEIRIIKERFQNKPFLDEFIASFSSMARTVQTRVLGFFSKGREGLGSSRELGNTLIKTYNQLMLNADEQKSEFLEELLSHAKCQKPDYLNKRREAISRMLRIENRDSAQTFRKNLRQELHEPSDAPLKPAKLNFRK